MPSHAASLFETTGESVWFVKIGYLFFFCARGSSLNPRGFA